MSALQIAQALEQRALEKSKRERERIEKENAKYAAKRKIAAEENRKNMPTIAMWTDGIREIFGKGNEMGFAEENGFTIGRDDKDDYVDHGRTAYKARVVTRKK